MEELGTQVMACGRRMKVLLEHVRVTFPCGIILKYLKEFLL